MSLLLQVSIPEQILSLFQDQNCLKKYPISTAKNGVGEELASEKTPRGLHLVRAKIGQGCPINTIFVGRRPTGEIFTPELKQRYPDRDWILTRILWLSGQERGRNRLGDVDTMRRYIYIHGTSEEEQLGTPRSKGCIRMRNRDIIDLFDCIPCQTPIRINEY